MKPADSVVRTWPAGRTIAMVDGDYDGNFELIAVFVTKREISIPDEVEAMMTVQGLTADVVDDTPNDRDFVEWLVSQGAVDRFAIDDEEYGLQTAQYCRHPESSRSWQLFGAHGEDQAAAGPNGWMMACCDACHTVFEETRRPGTDEEFLAVYPAYRHPVDGHRMTGEEYLHWHPELQAPFWPPYTGKGYPFATDAERAAALETERKARGVWFPDQTTSWDEVTSGPFARKRTLTKK